MAKLITPKTPGSKQNQYLIDPTLREGKYGCLLHIVLFTKPWQATVVSVYVKNLAPVGGGVGVEVREGQGVVEDGGYLRLILFIAPFESSTPQLDFLKEVE